MADDGVPEVIPTGSGSAGGSGGSSGSGAAGSASAGAGSGSAESAGGSRPSASGGSSTRSMATLRLLSDLKSITSDPPPGCSASPSTEDNIFQWSATVVGPDESPWEGGIFSLQLTFPDEYPSKPPRVRFTCDMFHPNIYSDGQLCLDILQTLWKPVYTVGMLLTSIQSLLVDPNCASPANLDAAQMLTENPKEYRRRVRRIAARSVEG